MDGMGTRGGYTTDLPGMFLCSPLPSLFSLGLLPFKWPTSKRKVKAPSESPSSLILFNLVSIFQILRPHSLYPMISEE
jgi:hypothetical protein